MYLWKRGTASVVKCKGTVTFKCVVCVLMCVCEREREDRKQSTCEWKTAQSANDRQRGQRERMSGVSDGWKWVSLNEAFFIALPIPSTHLGHQIISFSLSAMVAILIYFIFSVAAALIPMNITRSAPIPHKIPKHLVFFFSLLPKKF